MYLQLCELVSPSLNVVQISGAQSRQDADADNGQGAPAKTLWSTHSPIV